MGGAGISDIRGWYGYGIHRMLRNKRHILSHFTS